MAITNVSAVYPSEGAGARSSAVSWGAIVAGGAAAASLSLILLILGTGLGLSAVSPWANEGAGAITFGVSTILWLTFTQLAASSLGGYLAGRLRGRWADTPSDEIYFRDSAHGFLSWAVASLMTATLLASAVGSIVGTGLKAGAVAAGGVAGTVATVGAVTDDAASTHYLVDSLFRSSAAADANTPVAPATEVTRIFLNTVRAGPLPAEDLRYVGQLIAQRTGLAQADAEKRVSDTYSRLQAQLSAIQNAARDTADKARKASAYAALWLFISLLAGAFISSLTATVGGRQRDA